MEENKNEWIKQIGFFKNNCVEKLPVEDADMDIANIKKGLAEDEEDEAK